MSNIADLNKEKQKRSRSDEPANTIEHAVNAVTAIVASNELDLFYDVFADRIQRQWHGEEIKDWEDHDATRLTDFLQRAKGYKRLTKATVRDAVGFVARKHEYDPPREWIESLKWDSKNRIDSFFTKFFGTQDTEYTRTASTNFFISLAARITRPGCKVDNTVILISPQGFRKTSVLEILGGDYYASFAESPQKKDFAQGLRGKFLLELCELQSMNKADVSAIKATLSKREDWYRPSHGEHFVLRKRRCVFVGTTNEAEFLRDPTGGRRFWPIEVTKTIDTDAVSEIRDQLFAEALHRLNKEKATWWVMPEVETRNEQEARRQADPWEEIIEAWIGEREYVTTTEIFDHLIGPIPILANHLTPREHMRAAQILKLLGFQKRRFGPDRRWRWERTK